jgi:hypothetical protein
MAAGSVSSKFATVVRVTSGNFLEMFDFFLFGFYASHIAHTFFPSGDEFASLLLTFMTFGAGFLMRPLGAIILGAYVDRVGRRLGLIVTLSLMAMGTILIALVPAYATIGLLAPLLVLIGRLLQGFSAGGGRARWRLSLFIRNGDARAQGLLCRLAVRQPAGRDHRRGADRVWLEQMADARRDQRLGLARPVFHRLPDRALYFRDSALPPGNRGVPIAMKARPS